MNNFTYGMTGGQMTPTTPTTANASTTPYGNYEYPFSLPFLADACGATYVARWTSLHARNITNSIGEAMNRKGFSFIEVIAPCTTLYQRRNRLGDGLDAMEYYARIPTSSTASTPASADISYQGKIATGKFVDREKPTYFDAVNTHYANVIGDDYQLYGMNPRRRRRKPKRRRRPRASKQDGV